MKILHYSLGFPPYRRGGLTKYCIDVAKEEVEQGHDVGILWPGEMSFFYKKNIKVIRKKDFITDSGHIKNYEMKEPLPVSLLEGISDVNSFIAHKSVDDGIKSIIEEFSPDILHVHTVMGLPVELLNKIKNYGVKTIFTVHDFFCICPKVAMINNEGIQCDGLDSFKCAKCNKFSIGIKKIVFLQSPVYRKLKNTYFLRKIRRVHWNNSLKENKIIVSDDSNNPDFLKLRLYYERLLNSFDLILFNSSVTQERYERVFSIKTNRYSLPITHSGIKEHTGVFKKKSIVTFAYLGPRNYFKGYDLLIDSFKKIYEEGYNFVLNVYFEDDSNRYDFVKYHAPYNYNDLDIVMGSSDCVVIPSYCETFGFVLPEALSYGVPVLSAKGVGANDILSDGYGTVFNPTVDDLCLLLKKIINDPVILQKWQNNILNTYVPLTIANHVQELIKIYKE